MNARDGLAGPGAAADRTAPRRKAGSLALVAAPQTLALAFCFATGGAAPAEILRVYGPGGPLPLMREAAEAFGRARGVEKPAVRDFADFLASNAGAAIFREWGWIARSAS